MRIFWLFTWGHICFLWFVCFSVIFSSFYSQTHREGFSQLQSNVSSNRKHLLHLALPTMQRKLTSFRTNCYLFSWVNLCCQWRRCETEDLESFFSSALLTGNMFQMRGVQHEESPATAAEVKKMKAGNRNGDRKHVFSHLESRVARWSACASVQFFCPCFWGSRTNVWASLHLHWYPEKRHLKTGEHTQEESNTRPYAKQSR